MSDYVVRFSGLDNLSGTLSKIKLELDRTGDSGSKLDLITAKFERISNSTAPLKKKLRDIQNTLALMNVDGLNESDIYHKMAALAAEYEDALGDARLATRLLSSDTANLDAGIAAFSAVTGAATIATGVMGLFGTENEKVELAILKVLSALAILSGVLAIANTLNKDSILMLKIKQIQELANASATAAATGATTLNTFATGANTIATQAWNVAKAIGKALLGDFSGLLIVGAGVLGTYAVATTMSADATDEQSEATKKADESTKQYLDTVAKELAQYQIYIAQLKNFTGSKEQEALTVEELNNKYGETLGYYSSVSSWYQTLIRNSEAYCLQLVLEARQRAIASKLEETARKKLDIEYTADGKKKNYYTSRIETKTNGFGGEKKVRVRDKTISAKETIAWKAVDEEELRWVKAATDNAANKSNIKFDKSGASTVKPITKPVKKKTPKQTNKTKQLTVFKADADTLQLMEDNISVLRKKLSNLKVDSSDFTKVSKEIEDWQSKIDTATKGFEDGSVADYAQQIDKIDSQLKTVNLTEEDRNKLVKQRASLEELIANKERTYLIGSIAYLEELIKKIQDRLSNEKLTADMRVTLITNISELQKQIDDISDNTTIKVSKLTVADLDKLDSYENAQANADTIVKQVEIGIIDKEEAENQIASINEQLQSIGLKPLLLHIESDAEKLLSATADAIDLIGSNLSSIGSNIGMPELDVAGVMAQSIATMVNGYAQATAQAASLGPWAWIAFAALGAAQLAAIVGLVKSMGNYANGGIIGGGSTHGDMLTAKVNAGEMILNGRQQKNLFSLLDNGGAIGGKGGGEVTFRIEGSTLKGALRNYDNKMSKLR